MTLLMKNKFLSIYFLMLAVGNCCAMDKSLLPYNRGNAGVDCFALHQKLLSCLGLPEDVAGHIGTHLFTADSYGEQLQTLAFVSKDNGEIITTIPKDAQALRKFIKNVSSYFQCSNENITNGLPWQFARDIMFIQSGLFTMCNNPINTYCKSPEDLGNVAMLERLCGKEGNADLNFTHGEKCTTPFMALCASRSRAENDTVIRLSNIKRGWLILMQ
jgi:hypothetical protein